jgi:hypothetical protein
VRVERCGGFAAFCNRPYNQRLSPAHIACGEYILHGRLVVLVRLDVTSRIQFNSQFFN